MSNALSECAFLAAHATTRETPAHLTLIYLTERHSLADLHDFTDEVTSENGAWWREAYEMLMVGEFCDEKGAISESNDCRVTLELSLTFQSVRQRHKDNGKLTTLWNGTDDLPVGFRPTAFVFNLFRDSLEM